MSLCSEFIITKALASAVFLSDFLHQRASGNLVEAVNPFPRQNAHMYIASDILLRISEASPTLESYP